MNLLPESIRRAIIETIARHEATWGLGVQPRLNPRLHPDHAAEVFYYEPRIINVNPDFVRLAQILIDDRAFLATGIEDVITHEYGHCLDLSMEDPLALQRDFMEIGGSATQALLKSELSGNASTNLTEAIGEAFLKYHQEGGAENRWAKAAIRMFKEAHNVN